MYGCICFDLFISGISADSDEIILILDYSADIPAFLDILLSKFSILTIKNIYPVYHNRKYDLSLDFQIGNEY